MNILQQEDAVKGLPDQRLMQEAQAPSGMFPQFLLVSEVQRRTIMRQGAAEKPEDKGTISDQVLQEGIGGLQRAGPQQGGPPTMGQQPPGMRQGLPTGQGIAPNPQQFPPPEPQC